MPLQPFTTTRVVSQSSPIIPETSTTKKETGLPYAWSWHTGGFTTGTERGDPEWQAEQVSAGRKIIPIFQILPLKKWTDTTVKKVTTDAVTSSKDNNLPVFARTNNLFYKIGDFEPFASYSLDPNTPDDHAWWISLVGGLPNTNSRNMSPWSKLSYRWCYELGITYAKCDQIVNAASIYPNPPMVLLGDNDENGFDWSIFAPDIRVDTFQQELDIQEMEAISAAIPAGAKGEDVFGEVIRKRWYEKFWEQSRRRFFAEFTRGWIDGLLTHNEHWAMVSGWTNFAQYQSDLDGGNADVLNNDLTYKNGFLGPMNPNLYIGEHQYGSTGAEYLYDWYGDWSTVRSSGQFSNTRTTRDIIQLREGQRGRGKGHITTLTWEGATIPSATPARPPARAYWKNFINCFLWLPNVGTWVDHCFTGDFISSARLVHEDEFAIHYDELLNQIDSIHNNPTLKDYWMHGELVRSLDSSPNIKQDFHEVYRDVTWYYQHVTENIRFDDPIPVLTSAKELRLALAMYNRGNDNFKSPLDNRYMFEVACFAVSKDDKILLYAASVLDEYSDIEVKLPVEHPVADSIKTITVPSAPVGGQFYELDLTADTLTAI